MKRVLATCLFCSLPLSMIPNSARACTLPLNAYDAANAAAAVKATVTGVQGSGLGATYDIRRTAIIESARPPKPIPTRLRIRMADYVLGTCGSQSPVLRAGDRITLYFEIRDGTLRPSGWKLS